MTLPRLMIVSAVALVTGCVSQPRAFVVEPLPGSAVTGPGWRCSDVGECVAAIRRKVNQHWRIPPGVPRTMTAALSIRLDREGRVTAVKVARSSGNRAFDESAVDAVRRASPFSEIDGLPAADREKFDEVVLKFAPDR